MADNQIKLVIKAVDKATGPLNKITERINKFKSPFKAIGKDFGSFFNAAGIPAVGSALKNVGSEVVSLGAKLAAMGAAAGFALYSIVKNSVDAGDKLSEVADRVGLSVDTFASLQYAAAQADVSQEQFNDSMDTFNKRLGEAKAGGGPLLTFLKKVSPALAKQVVGAKTTESALSLMTDAFSRIEDPAKRAALQAAVFGKGALAMGGFLAQGSAAIQAQQVEYLRLAGSQEAWARASGILDNALRKTETAFLGLGSTIGGALFPVFEKLADKLTKFIEDNRDGLKKWAEGSAAAIQRWLDSGGFDRLVNWFSKIADGIGWVVDKLGPWGVAIAAGAVLIAPLVVALGGLAVAFVGVLGALAPFGFAIAGVIGFATIMANVALVIHKNWDALIWTFEDLGATAVHQLSAIKDAFFSLWDSVKGIVDKLGGAMSILQNPIGAAFKGGKMLFEHVTAASSQRMLGAQAAAPVTQSLQSTEAKVSVDFNNLPPGARVSRDPRSTQPVDLSMGYTGVHP